MDSNHLRLIIPIAIEMYPRQPAPCAVMISYHRGKYKNNFNNYKIYRVNSYY